MARSGRVPKQSRQRLMSFVKYISKKPQKLQNRQQSKNCRSTGRGGGVAAVITPLPTNLDTKPSGSTVLFWLSRFFGSTTTELEARDARECSPSPLHQPQLRVEPRRTDDPPGPLPFGLAFPHGDLPMAKVLHATGASPSPRASNNGEVPRMLRLCRSEPLPPSSTSHA
ncbi:hypothetical protein MYCTH_2306494 [Thermothelomyces thermophilus ATCC 42464]|uniref:Uncharacterized protein n=1 Tax=Thermothelomyces thermophilus (strain ATCC 42464 / BCRC 31852 / DSM 1799) TaxID=573729 RepID=G2QHI0_THET4|nr:uncharacterized protein MYCTH_2306494 [Thermothelomyces thermophilus ATCC 42464]AEO58840.1 hypothetical protein MYCTH_2306494 [Thermothelomyces thermophilus ATCC 42464]